MRVNSPIKTFIKETGKLVCKHIPALRKLRNVYWAQEQKNYERLIATAQVNPTAVFFESYGGKKYACSPRAIYEQMVSDPRFEGWTFYWSFEKDALASVESLPALAGAQKVERLSPEYFQALATCGYWVQNNRVPEYVVPTSEQTYVQCWHGTPLKRLGRDVPETTSGGALNSAKELADRFALDAQKWTYLVSPSTFTSQHLADAFDLPKEKRDSVILEVGYPRNDFIANTLNAADSAERLAALRDAYGIPQDKKALLYAPTWRDDQFTAGVGYTMDSLMDFDALQKQLGDEWVVLLRTHYYIANKFDLSAWSGFVYNVSDAEDINDLYCISDAICTDYSSVFFDYAVTGRPMYFYWPDREHYEKDLHGFYLDPDTLPGPKCETAQGLADAVANYDSWFETYGEGYKAFRKEFCGKDDGHAANRVIDAVFC